MRDDFGRKRMRFVVSVFLLLSSTIASAQHWNMTMGPEYSGRSLLSLLEKIQQDNPALTILYDRPSIEGTTLPHIISRLPLQRIFKDYLYGHHLTFLDSNILLIYKDAETSAVDHSYPFVFYKLRKQGTGFLLKGSVFDDDGNPLSSISVHMPKYKRGVVTDSHGDFELVIPVEQITLIEFSMNGFETLRYNVVCDDRGKISQWNVRMWEQPNQLMEFVKIAERVEEQMAKPLSGIQQISMESIRKLPTFMGEIDPIRSLSSLPGVTSGELTSGFNVRGGDVGQNLVMQDNAFIFNPSHLFGFFSAFNPDIVNNFTLYKGGGPSSYGGRIASVLDVQLKNGATDRHHVTGGVGLISSRLSAEGPLKKGGRGSYIVGGRMSYTNWLLKATNQKLLEKSAANFYDITAKVSLPIGDKDFISTSIYHSADYFRLLSDSTFGWSTTNASIYWDHTYTDKLVHTVTLSQSNYETSIRDKYPSYMFQYRNGIQSWNAKAVWNYHPTESLKSFIGSSFTTSQINVGETSHDGDRDAIMPKQRSLEGALFAESEITVTSAWAATVGLRYSFFQRHKGDEQPIYDYFIRNGRYPSVVGEATYDAEGMTRLYHGFEPRVSLRYSMSEVSTLKASFYRAYQYLHLITNTTSATPLDYWITSGEYLKPQWGDQFSLGYFTRESSNAYEFSIEAFYKRLHDVVDYIDGAQLTMNRSLDGGILQGEGEAYGVEFLAKKNTGRLTGWLSYTYSRSFRTFSEATGMMDVVNKGKRYPSAFDQPHVGSLVMVYQTGKRSHLSMNFQLSSGRPITIPISKFSYDVYLSSLVYSNRNEYRLPLYHRMDVSMTFKGKNRRRFQDEWILSVFNLYSRKNTYSIMFNRYGNAKKISVLGSIFPSVTYQFKF